jgi:hypothetical protein
MILQDPVNVNILYVLTAAGGLWKTTNFALPLSPGVSLKWTSLTDFLDTTSGGAIAFGRGNTIFYVTGDPFGKQEYALIKFSCNLYIYIYIYISTCWARRKLLFFK